MAAALISVVLIFCSLVTVEQSGFLGVWGQRSNAQSPFVEEVKDPDEGAEQDLLEYESKVRPWIKRYCYECHNESSQEAGVRLDTLEPSLPDPTIPLWTGIRKHVADESMPPKEALQPSESERAGFLKWVDGAIHKARTRPVPKNGALRRLTVQQYDRSLKSLLGIETELTEILPPDGVSKDGFTNQMDVLQMTPLQLDTFLEIARKAIDSAIVDPQSRPRIQAFRMEFGKDIHPNPSKETLILGANNHLLANQDFVVHELEGNKPFPYDFWRMQKAFRFIEGYQGNDTVRGWKEFLGIHHAVFACMRGSEGYPIGRAYELFGDGLALRPAIPSPEIFGESSTYGPHANFKISLRELPDRGPFQIRVKASKVNDALLVTPPSSSFSFDPLPSVSTSADLSSVTEIAIEDSGVYAVEVYAAGLTPSDPKKSELTVEVTPSNRPAVILTSVLQSPVFALIRLDAGLLRLSARFKDSAAVEKVVLRRLDKSGTTDTGLVLPDAVEKQRKEWLQEFIRFEARSPKLGVHIGLRRDCGSTLSQVGSAAVVTQSAPQEYVFEGAIENFPSPDVETDNVNYLAGIREIGVRHEFTDGRPTPRLVLHSIEFEGPYYTQWPPQTHRSIFPDKLESETDSRYAMRILSEFARRAFRRPLTEVETSKLQQFWQQQYDATADIRSSVSETLCFILVSPQFLYISESSDSPEPELMDSWELASKLSYFLWDGPPDEELMTLAKNGTLFENLDAQIERMISDPKSFHFVETFVSQWLGLHKLDTVEVDRKKFPYLTKEARQFLRLEPIHTFYRLLKENRSIEELIASDEVVVNEPVASYYGLGDRIESGFDFIPIKHERQGLGGILGQAGMMIGLSDGREANPVKRGAWFARKMIDAPPEDPPPNVPKLEDLTQLTLREKLERHRSVPGCANCHAGIDPWGLPFEAFDASGRFQMGAQDNSSTLPPLDSLSSGVYVENFEAFRKHLLDSRIDQFAQSITKHLATYACGRRLTYNESTGLRENIAHLKESRYRLGDIVRWVIRSKMFLEK